MSDVRFASLARGLNAAAVEAAWIQWQALGAQSAADRLPSAIVDPEALILVSLWLADKEPRFRDFLIGFAERGSRIVSVQRLKRALQIYPSDAEARVAGFASVVVSFGKDPRWKRLAGHAPGVSGRPGKVGPLAMRMGDPGSLLLRLRTAFGVDVRTDTLTYLIGRRQAWADVKEISEALLYAKYSVRTGCEALADARLIASRSGRPVRYCAERRRWFALLDLADAPPWYPWIAVYGFMLRLDAWLRESHLSKASASLAASLAREFMSEHGAILADLQLDLPDERDYLGEGYLAVFEQAVNALADWLKMNV